MELQPPEIVNEPEGVQVRCGMRTAGRSDTLWCGLERCHAHDLTVDRHDGPRLGSLLKAMVPGEHTEDIKVRGAVSERLDGGDDQPRSTGVGSDFSAGSDSSAIVYDHYIKESRGGSRVGQLLSTGTLDLISSGYQ